MGAQDWLCSVAIQEPDDKRAYDYVRQWFWDNGIELPVSNRIDRIIKGKGAAMGTPYLTGGKWEIQPLKNNDFFGVKSGGPYLAGIGKFKRYDEIYKR
jgi:hypothetical protein